MNRRSFSRIMVFIAFAFPLIIAACAGADQPLKVGDQAVDFTLPEAIGGEVDLADYLDQEQPVLLYFSMADG